MKRQQSLSSELLQLDWGDFIGTMIEDSVDQNPDSVSSEMRGNMIASLIADVSNLSRPRIAELTEEVQFVENGIVYISAQVEVIYALTNTDVLRSAQIRILSGYSAGDLLSVATYETASCTIYPSTESGLDGSSAVRGSAAGQ